MRPTRILAAAAAAITLGATGLATGSPLVRGPGAGSLPIIAPAPAPGAEFMPVYGWSNPVPGRRGEGDWAVDAVRWASDYCASLPDKAYQIDCLAERFAYVAGQLDARGAYSQTRWALNEAAKRLAWTAGKYRDSSRTPKRFSSKGSGRTPAQTSTRPIRPIRPAAADTAVALARGIVAETETLLLRSSADNPAIRTQVRDIAAAVGSNKFLLRSA